MTAAGAGGAGGTRIFLAATGKCRCRKPRRTAGGGESDGHPG